MPTDSLDLLALILAVALAYMVLVGFYESLSTRDLLVDRLRRRFPDGLGSRPARVGYLAVVAGVIPTLLVIWTLGLWVGIVLVDSVDSTRDAAVVAVAVVGAARVLAYANGRASHELAKAVPLALSFLLLTGGSLRLDEKLTRLQQGDVAPLTFEMLGLLVVLELGMRAANDGSHAFLAARRRKLGIEDRDGWGVWRTLRALLGGSGGGTRTGSEPPET